MTTILCFCLALLHIFVAHVQFVGSQQATADAAFPMGTGTTGTQTGVFSSSSSNSPAPQNGFSTPTQTNEFSRTRNSSPTGSTNPFSQTGMFSSTGSNSSLTQGGVVSQTQPDLSQTGFSSTAQSNNQFSQTGFTSPTQTNPSTFPGSNLSNNTPNGFINQNSNSSSLESNMSNTQPGIFSQNTVVSSSSSSSFIPTQPNSATVQNSSAMPNLLPNPATQNGDILSNQTGISSTQNNGFVPINTDSSTSPTNFVPSFPNNNSAVPQPGSTPAHGSASQSVIQLTLAAMLAGQYSTMEQVQEDNAKGVTGANKHTLIEVSYIPVIVPALGQAVVFYYEQRVNNSAQPTRQAIYAFSPESACLTRMSTYDIANASRFSVSAEGLQALETLTLAELSNRPECDALWEYVDDEIFTSFLSSDRCTFEVSPRVMVRPIVSRNLTCSGMIFIEVWRRVASNEMVSGSPVPHVFKKTGNAFPVPVHVFSSNTCFKVPCMGRGVASPAGPSWSDIKQHMNYAANTNNGTSQNTSVL